MTFSDGDDLMNKRLRAFTLIELMVVMALIAILMGLVMSGLSRAKLKAQISRAEVDMKAMELAIRNYRLEYSHWPGALDGLPGNQTWTANNQDLVKYLVSSNPVPPYEVVNPRRRVFWEKEGVSLTFNDSWGMPYSVTIDVANSLVRIVSGGPDKNMATGGDNLTYEGR